MFTKRLVSHVFSILFNVLLVLSALIGSGVFATGVRAAGSIVVTTNADNTTPNGQCSLREAIINANADNQSGSVDCAAGSGTDTITFNADYTITLGSQLPTITSTIIITGNGAANTIIQASATPNTVYYKVFEVGATGNTTLNSLTIRNGCKQLTTLFGGGIYNSGALTIHDVTISGNSSDGGAGIYNGGTLTVNTSTISGNNVAGRGGGIYNQGTMTLTNSIVSNNTATQDGGGVYNFSGSLTITNSTLSGNSAADGSGVYHLSGTLTVTNSTLSGNPATGSGGAIYAIGGTSTVTNSTISGNSATDSGGGVYNGGGTLTVTNSTLSGNSAVFGGGLFNISTLTVTNSSISGNSATTSGGGTYNSFGGTLLNYTNTIIANSTSGGDCVVTTGATIGTNINNLVEDGSCSASLNGDPNLGPLTSNSGLTQTMALNSGSTAIDAGVSCSAAPVNGLDQRGYSRDVSCDIGAYEYGALSPAKDITTFSFTSPAAIGTITGTNIAVTVPFGTDITALVATFTTTGAAVAVGAVPQTSGMTANDFTNPVSYTVTAADASTQTYTVTVTLPPDTTMPTATSILRANPSPTSAASIDFTMTFSEAVNGVDTGDFSLTTTGVTGATVTGVGGSGASYTVSVNTGTGNGTIRLDVLDDNTIQDAAGNPLDGPFSGEIYAIDKTITLTLTSTGAQDGWVLESTETSGIGATLNNAATTFNLGDDALKKQYRAILSFSTGAGLPDSAHITGVTLKIRKSAIVGGGNPLTTFQGFMLDIRKGFFGTTAALQTGDFNALANIMSLGPYKPVPVSNWYSIDLTSQQGYINKLAAGSGLTQFRLRFKLDDNNNAVANYLTLFSGNAPAANRPQLVIKYYIP